jgi:hypothetical protein
MVLACLNPPRDYSAGGARKFLPARITRGDGYLGMTPTGKFLSR